MIEDNPKLKALLACEMDAWVENDPIYPHGRSGCCEISGRPRGQDDSYDERKGFDEERPID